MKVHTVNYDLSSFLINAQGKLGLYHLLNILQDAASAHAELLGLGFEEMTRMKMFWVLTRQSVKMDYWPKWKDTLTVKTWIRAEEGVASNRDFRIYVGDKLIGEATTSWLPLSADTRRPVAWDRTAVMGKFQNEDRVSIDTGKVSTLKEPEKLASFKVRNSDLDQNMHVNNTKYAQWVLDALPYEDHVKYGLSEYRVNFLAETHLGDLIRIERQNAAPELVVFQGVRESDEKPVFTASLNFYEK